MKDRSAEEVQAFSLVAGRVVRSAKLAIATAVALLPLAYVSGYFYAQGYYRSVGASWLVQVLGTRLLLSYGLVPVVLVALPAWVIAAAIEGSENDPTIFRHLKPRIAIRLLIPVLSAAGVVMLFALPVVPVAMVFLGWLIIAALLYLAMWNLWYLLAALRGGRWRGAYGDFLPLFFFLLIAFFFVPWIKGIGDGGMAASPRHSHLPRPEIDSGTVCEEPRLLFADESSAVIGCLGEGKESGAGRQILIVDLKEIGAIHSVGR